MERLKLGAVGWLYHYDNEHAKTTAVCRRNVRELQAFEDEHPGTQTYTDYRKMADEAGLDAVVISTPNWVHREMAEYYLERGIDVFLEKPMGINREEMDSLLATQRKSGKTLAIDFELRISTGSTRVREIIESGEIGEPNGIEFIHHRGAWLAQGNNVYRTDPARSGGLFLMEVCHEIDFFRWLMGEITHVQSFRHRNVLPQYKQDEMPDNVCTHVWFEGGRMGTINASHTSSVHGARPGQYDDLGHDMYFIITGTEGCIRMECVKRKILVCRYEDFHPDADVGRRVAFGRLEDYSSVEGFHHEIKANIGAFLESCSLGRPFHQDAFDAWKSHVVCLAAERSALEDFQRIEIDYTPA
jgi:predicted dehydrogenase